MSQTINSLLIICLTICPLFNGFKLSSNSCGKSKVHDIDWRVIDGQNASPGEFPWQITMTEIVNPVVPDHCGGTIINERWVLTAAHCVDAVEHPDQYEVRFGVHNRTGHDVKEVDFLMEKVVIHPKWTINITKGVIMNDIALIKINGSLDLNGKHDYLEPICLPTPETTFTDNCVATGWGVSKWVDEKHVTRPEILQKVREPIDVDSVCKWHYPTNFDSETQLCCGSNGHGICHSDSGGPIQCEGSDGKWYQLGLVSYGGGQILCGKTPDVFTKVSAYMEWIESIIKND